MAWLFLAGKYLSKMEAWQKSKTGASFTFGKKTRTFRNGVTVRHKVNFALVALSCSWSDCNTNNSMPGVAVVCQYHCGEKEKLPSAVFWVGIRFDIIAHRKARIRKPNTAQAARSHALASSDTGSKLALSWRQNWDTTTDHKIRETTVLLKPHHTKVIDDQRYRFQFVIRLLVEL